LSESLSKIFALILAVLLFYIFPVENMLTRQEDVSRVFVLTETTKFVDSVRSLGYITPLMYMQFTRNLSATGISYDIEMEHLHSSINPVYTDPVDIMSFQHDYGLHYSAAYTDEILETLFPETPAGGEIKYYLSKRDYFNVIVSNKNKTIATKVQEMLIMTDLPTKRIIINYGGMVRDENN
jgi:hypothetical protein